MLSKLFSSKAKETSIEWKNLTKLDELEALERASEEKPVMIFKHSTRCGISAMALNRFERAYEKEANFDPYYLDLIANRELSNEIANRYGVIHESPQALLIVEGKVVHDSSHNGIDFNEINAVSANKN